MTQNNTLLSIDIGGTNINFTTFSMPISINELHNKRIKKVKTLGWLNHSLPKLFLQKKIQGLINNRKDSIDSISVCVPFDMDQNGNLSEDDYYVKEHNVPINIKEQIAKIAQKPTTIQNDAMAWIKGALKYYHLKKIEIAYPALMVCLGTGVGISIAKDEENCRVFNMDQKLEATDFKTISRAANYWKYNKPGKIQNILGYHFFNWIRREKKIWDLDTIEDEYTKRLKAFLEDISKTKILNYKETETIIFGGGSTRYINKSMFEKDPKEFIRDKTLHFISENSIDIEPDLIPLIGNIPNDMLE